MTENRESASSAKRIGLLIIVLTALAGLGWWLKDAVLPAPLTAVPLASPTGGGTVTPTAGDAVPHGEPYNMNVQLSAGQAGSETSQPQPFASGEPLSAQDIEQLLAHLPALPPGTGEQVDFKLPQELLPPPRPGQTITEPFPPLDVETGPGNFESVPLEVLRYAPQGEIPIAPFISITFNQPMVPLGTLGDLAAQDVPVRITPALPGTWRWLGTRTLTFEYDSTQIDRLPKATEYQVTVPAGTKSPGGGDLAEAVTWTFSTPAPRMVSSYPNSSPQRLDPVFVVIFDQRIDPLSVLPTLRVDAGGREVKLILADQADLERDEQAGQWVQNAPEGRWIAFRAVESFPADTAITVNIGPNTPSAEGPRVTQDVQTFGFSTYAPLRIVNYGCGWSSDPCPPLTPFRIQFNNPIDTTLYSDELLRISPEIPGLLINLYYSELNISGQTRGQTTYTVTVSGKIQDIYGQTLGDDTRLTFKVGKADAYLFGSGQNFVTLDPSLTKPVFSLYAINQTKLDVKIYSVQPADWPAFTAYLDSWRWESDVPPLPGKLVYDDNMNLDLPTDTLSQVDIDLSRYTKGNFGHFIVITAPPKALFEDDSARWRRMSQTVVTWVQVTQIGLDAFTDPTQMVAWATDLKSGSPLSGVSILPDGLKSAAKTDADGVAHLDLPVGASFLAAQKGNDSALLPRYWGWEAGSQQDSLRWYVYDDRQMYRPGEEVHLKGWLRTIGGGPNGDVSLPGSQVSSVSYQITDPLGNSLGSGQVDVNALGGFDFAFTVPEQVNLGYAQVSMNAASSLDGTYYSHGFQIQEFRRPEFEVTARNEEEGPFFAGDQASVSVEAKYYAGGGLPNADVTWLVTTSPGSYSPPNWPDFTFGTWQPWWWFEYIPAWNNGGIPQTFNGKTDAAGFHYLNLDFQAQGEADPRPYSITAEATVMDVNRQAWTSSTSLLVHPADLYIGLRSQRYFVGRGTPLQIDFIVTDLDGNAVSGRPVVLTAARMEWKLVNGEWVEQAAETQTCEKTSKSEPDSCPFETAIGGQYQITAIVTDKQGRKNQSQITRWVSGGERPASRRVEQEQVTLIPDKESYQPGDTAQILVQSPFSPADGLLTVSRSGILYTQSFHIEEGSITLDIPILEQHIPNLNIQIDLVGAAPRTDERGQPLADLPPRPAFASAQLNLSIPPLERTLSVDVTPDESQLEPGGETTLTVSVQDANGQPVPDAEVAVVVVDEAILALSNYQVVDPLSIFYSDRSSDVSSLYGRATIVLADPQALAQQAELAKSADSLMAAGAPMPTGTPMEMPAMEALPNTGGGGVEQQTITVRSDFNPLAAFEPTVRTSSNGEARVRIQLPDNLTRYRIMAVAVDEGGQQFGSGESNLTARLPLMVRPSAPRFLNFGDRFELPVVLQNQTDQPMTVDVAARAANLNLLSAGQRVTIPANDRVEVRFEAAADMAGTATIQIAATAGDYADAATVSLPVFTPATTEAFATYGVLDADSAIAQSVQYPTGVFPQYGGLEVTTSSTALQALTDAVLYLQNYPYECSEQLSSRILSVAALRDVLSAFEAEGLPSPAEMESAVGRDLARLQGMQNYDGGFPYWQRGFDSNPFNTVHVTHALVRAQQKGFDVPAEMLQNALGYLRQIEDHYPSWYGPETRRTLSAYALYVRNLAGDRDAIKAQSLLNETGLENFSLQAIGWLWPVIEDEQQLEAIRTHVNNRVVETAGAANFTTAYGDQSYLLLSSDRRTDAILLDALIEDNPQSDLIPKLVNGLLAHRVKGRWGNTQENVFVLLALDRYFNTYESETPDFVARLWLGNTYAGESEFRGYSTEQHETTIPMNYVLSETAGGAQNFILGKEGAGRLYYRLGLRYAPTDLNLDPLDMGFVVTRTYEAVDNPEDVYQDEGGVWHIKAGARVRVRLTMLAQDRRYHVALTDPLPAGLEIVNPALAVSGSTPQDPTDPNLQYGWWWYGTWYEHQNLRDYRAEAFTSLLWDGVYEYTYIARATTPGTFIVPPAKAEEMYSPEVFGRSGSDWVIVE
ncbi:MAG: hypothetical protein HY869_04740 [Chloroflexi bacterium]|nr:hypothetical protein [Chloroflexota bacterium]